MSNTTKFDPEDLDPNVLNEELQSLSYYYIPKRRLTIRASEKTLGVGGFGTVKLADLWPATWIPFVTVPTTVAVKELRTDNHNVTPLRTAFRLAREIKLWASCEHDNILKFTGYYLSQDFRTAYLVSPYMANGNIKDYLSRETPSQRQRLGLVLDTIKGLAYLHSRTPPIVHGDLKSLNVLVTNTRKAVLCDLGLAKAMEDKPTGLSTSNGFKGTIRHTSPEVLNGSPRDCPSDIWAWGCLALEIITGKPPYYECKIETQVLVLICGPQDHRRTPEPSDISLLPSTALDLLRMCWSFEPGHRPDARQCVDEVETIFLNWDLFSLGLPEHLFFPPSRLNFSPLPEHRSDLVDGISIARLSLQGTDAVVMVKCVEVSDYHSLWRPAQEFDRRRALKHKNLLEISGYSISQDLGKFYVICPHQPVLLQYLRQNRHLAPRARLKLLQDILKGLVYLESSAVDAGQYALNPWTVVVNSEGMAVLTLVAHVPKTYIPMLQQALPFLTARPPSPPRFLSVPSPSVPSAPSVGNFTEMIYDGPPVRLWFSTEILWARPVTKPALWSWACIVLQVMCEIRQLDGTSIHSPKFMEDIMSLWPGQRPEPYPAPILPDRLLRLVRSCWHSNHYRRPSESHCLKILDLVIQEDAELAAGEVTIPGSGMA